MTAALALSCAGAADTFRCPTKWDLWRQTMALLPPGRAWQSHDVGVERFETGHTSEVGPFELGVTGLGSEPVIEDLTRLEQYWAGHAEVMEFLHQRACALLEEFFCATTFEQRGEWGTDYGFPDPCEPWETLCDKVSAQGGATCAYLAEIAARRGWHIECLACDGPRADCLSADFDEALCECPPFSLIVFIDKARSPAFVDTWMPPIVDRIEADCHEMCQPVPDEVLCLIERVKPAHIRAHYLII